MIEWTEVNLFTTESDACVIGCGTPLIFLTWLPRLTILYCCPSCEGIWSEELFQSDNPRLYVAKEFGAQSVSPSLESEIHKAWHNIIICRESNEKYYFLELLEKLFGDKLIFR